MLTAKYDSDQDQLKVSFNQDSEVCLSTIVQVVVSVN